MNEKNINFEEIGQINTLGLDYDILEKIQVSGVNLFGVKKDVVKRWNQETATVTFYNKNEQPLAEIYFFCHETLQVDKVGTVKVMKAKELSK